MPSAGLRFEDPEHGAGRLALLATPCADGWRVALLVELAEWSAACRLTSGQLHRLTNGLAGRGRRGSVRPLALDGEHHVYLTGTPETLTVTLGEQTAIIPAGPRRGLSKALRAFEAQLS